jgi:hypothetical protein
VSDGFGPGVTFPPNWPAEQMSLAGQEAAFWPSQTAVAAWWQISDDALGSGIANFDVALCGFELVAPDASCPVQWTSVGTRTKASFFGLSLLQNARYRVWVRATDGVGIATAYISNGFVVDVTPALLTGVVATAAPALVGSWRSIVISVAGASDPESGIGGYLVCFDLAATASFAATEGQRTYPGLPCTTLARSVASTRAGLPLSALVTSAADAAAADANIASFVLAVSQRAGGGANLASAVIIPRLIVVNGAGLRGVVPLSPVTMSLQPPKVGEAFVLDAASWVPRSLFAPQRAKIQTSDRAQTNTSFLAVAWFGWGNPDVPVVRFALSIGTRTCRSDIVTSQIVPGKSSALLAAKLQPNRRYYVRIEAIDAAGLKSFLCLSNVMVTDVSPPVGGYAADVPASGVAGGVVPSPFAWTAARAQGRARPVFTSQQVIAVAFTSFRDLHSGIANLQLRTCASTDPQCAGSGAAWGPLLPPLTFSLVMAMNMAPGIYYTTQVAAIDWAGNKRIVLSTGSEL